jgi:hypothetical protein
MKRQHKKKWKREKKRAIKVAVQRENELLRLHYPELYSKGARANPDYYKPGNKEVFWIINSNSYRAFNTGPAPQSHDQL